MKHIAIAKWTGGLNFDATFDQNDTILKMSSEGNGFSPKRLLLAGLIGCTGMDVASMLKKMRAEPERFELEVEAELTDEHPRIYDKMHMIYKFYGTNLQKDKIEKAVELSVEKYCGVHAMFEKFSDLKHEIRINPES